MSGYKQQEEEFSLKQYLVPLTTLKAIHFIVIIGIIVFFNSLLNPFILDDIPQIVYSPEVHKLNSIPSFFYHSLAYPGINSLTLLHMYYKPLLFTTYTLLYSPFGGSTLPFHLLQLLIHIINVSLIFLIFSRFFKLPLAFVLSLIFLIHPINSETVIYIADMQDVLFVLFGLLAFYSFTKWKNQRLSYRRLSLVALLLLLSLLSKETGIIFAIIFLLYVWLFNRINFKRLISAITTTMIVYVCLRFIASFNSTPIMTLSLIQQEPFNTRIISIPKIIFYYISHFLFPVHFATGQEWLIKHVDLFNFVLPLLFDILFFVCITFCGIYVYRKIKKLFALYMFFLLWFCMGLLIHLQLIPLDLTVADRWFYFPMIGLLGIIGVISNSLNNKYFNKVLVVTFSLLIIACLSLLTIIRNSQWQTPMQLYSHDVMYAGESPVLYSYYGAMLMNNGQYDKAKSYLEKSISLEPQLGSNFVNLAIWYERKKDFTTAKKLFQKNILLNKKNSSYISVSYEGLARIALLYEKNPKATKEISQTGLQKYPSDTVLMEYLAASLYQLGEKDESLILIEKAYKYNPNPQNEKLYILIKNGKLTFPIDTY